MTRAAAQASPRPLMHWPRAFDCRRLHTKQGAQRLPLRGDDRRGGRGAACGACSAAAACALPPGAPDATARTSSVGRSRAGASGLAYVMPQPCSSNTLNCCSSCALSADDASEWCDVLVTPGKDQGLKPANAWFQE